jgi:hypothetical protein
LLTVAPEELHCVGIVVGEAVSLGVEGPKVVAAEPTGIAGPFIERGGARCILWASGVVVLGIVDCAQAITSIKNAACAPSPIVLALMKKRGNSNRQQGSTRRQKGPGGGTAAQGPKWIYT